MISKNKGKGYIVYEFYFRTVKQVLQSIYCQKGALADTALRGRNQTQRAPLEGAVHMQFHAQAKQVYDPRGQKTGPSKGGQREGTQGAFWVLNVLYLHLGDGYAGV